MLFFYYRLDTLLLRLYGLLARNFLSFSTGGALANAVWLSLEVYYGCPIAELWWLVGFSEGDGTFGVYKNRGRNRNIVYIKYEYGFGQHSEDMELLLRLQVTLKGIGHIRDGRKQRGERNVAYYRLNHKSDITYVLLPIFDTFPLLTTYKRYQYLYFKEQLLSGIVHYKDLPPFTYPYPRHNLFPTIDHILNLPYFDAWLIGFINAEGSFYIAKEGEGGAFAAFFSISQNDAPQIIEAIRARLGITSLVEHNETRDSYAITTNSIRGVSNVVDFMLNAPVKLRGVKHLQFIIWLINLTRLPRYKEHIKLPYDPLDY